MPGHPTTHAERHARLADLETGLQGLLHFYFVLGEHIAKGVTAVAQQRWYYGAFINQADMCFTADRGGDDQPGAALRCLRDLGRLDLKGKLDEALREPINANGRQLGDAIHRIRNEALVHHSFDFEEQGAALIYVGEPDPDMATRAYEKLAQAVTEVLDEVRREKVVLIRNMLLAGTLGEYSASLDTAANRAREKERRRRRAQRHPARADSAS